MAESLLKKFKKARCSEAESPVKGTRNVSVIPYCHMISHNLKKVGNRAGVQVVFSVPQKLSRICKAVNAAEPAPRCTTKHRSQFVECVDEVVYSVPLTCGKRYIGQTGRCLNERLKEHHYNVTRLLSGHLAIHCRDCGCKPIFEQTSVVRRCRDKTAREIIEAREIDKAGSLCVSAPSILLTKKELEFLSSRRG